MAKVSLADVEIKEGVDFVVSSVCGENGTCTTELNNHIDAANHVCVDHGFSVKSNSNVFLCPHHKDGDEKCCKTLTKSRDIVDHMFLHNPNYAIYLCSLCGLRFSTKRKMKSHHAHMHRGNERKNNMSNKIENENKLSCCSHNNNECEECIETHIYRSYLECKFNQSNEWERKYFGMSHDCLFYTMSQFSQHWNVFSSLTQSITIAYSSHNNNNNNNNNNNEKKDDNDNELECGFEIMFLESKQHLYLRAPNMTERNKWIDLLSDASQLKIAENYDFLGTLGTSESQMIKVVSSKDKRTKQNCAIKIVDKRICDKQELNKLVNVLQTLKNHQSCVEIYQCIETDQFLFIVTEQCEGGKLFDEIADLNDDDYDETQCYSVMYQIADGVKYMHSQGIVHCGLKPENILCVKPNSIDRVKIADFGISKMVKPESIQEATYVTMAGTLNYTAPEILKGQRYNKAVDSWSLGVIMYILLCGYAPFCGENDKQVIDNITNKKVEFKENWENVDKSAIALITGLLDKDASTRLSEDDVISLCCSKIGGCVTKSNGNNETCEQFWCNFESYLNSEKIFKEKLMHLKFDDINRINSRNDCSTKQISFGDIEYRNIFENNNDNNKTDDKKQNMNLNNKDNRGKKNKLEDDSMTDISDDAHPPNAKRRRISMSCISAKMDNQTDLSVKEAVNEIDSEATMLEDEGKRHLSESECKKSIFCSIDKGDINEFERHVSYLIKNYQLTDEYENELVLKLVEAANVKFAQSLFKMKKKEQ